VSVCPDCCMNALFLIVRSDTQRSFGKTFGSYPSCKVNMYIEKLEEVTLIFSKYQSTLLPMILSGDRLQFVMQGQAKTRVDKNSYSLEQKGVNESSRELKAKRWWECQLWSIAIKRLSRFKLFKIQKMKMMWTAEIQMKLKLRCHIFISFLQDTVP